LKGFSQQRKDFSDFYNKKELVKIQPWKFFLAAISPRAYCNQSWRIKICFYKENFLWKQFLLTLLEKLYENLARAPPMHLDTKMCKRLCAKMRVWTWPINPDFERSQLETISMKDSQCHIFHPLQSSLMTGTFQRFFLDDACWWNTTAKKFSSNLCVYHQQQLRIVMETAIKFLVEFSYILISSRI
jgi:hypothetical protein